MRLFFRLSAFKLAVLAILLTVLILGEVEDDALDAFDAIDVMVNNAGIMPLAFYADHVDAVDAWNRCIDVNFRGVLNGIDYNEWDPHTDPYILAPYSAEDLQLKQSNKHALQEAFGLRAAADSQVARARSSSETPWPAAGLQGFETLSGTTSASCGPGCRCAADRIRRRSGRTCRQSTQRCRTARPWW